MKLTALDIRKQEFSRTLRGYDPDEVDSFIEVISDQWKEMVDELKRDNDRISELELKLEHYHKVEEALEEALQTARSSARQTIVQADVKAKKIIEAAEEDAEKITRDARDHRRDIKREAAKFSVRRKEIVAKLRAFLLSEMEMLAHYDDDDPTGFIKLLGDVAGEQQRSRQPQLAAGSPVSDALENEQPQADEPQQAEPAPSAGGHAAPEAPSREPEYSYDEAEVHVNTTRAEQPPSEGVEPVEQRQAEATRQPQPRADTERHTDASAEQTTNEAPVDEAPASGPDDNDSFHSQYEQMATIQEVYGQFDPNASDDSRETATPNSSNPDATNPHVERSEAPSGDQTNGSYEDESYADESYADGSYDDGSYTHESYSDESYADASYPEDSYSDESYPDEAYTEDEYADDITGDGYADPAQGTGAHGREYPQQSRPAQDRPPADSPAASGQRAPGMKRPDAHQELSESATEDIEKIRRILEDLDN